MQENADLFQISAMSRAFDISRSGYYSWRHRQRQSSPGQWCRQGLDDAVKKAFHTRKRRFGSPGLTLDLAESGLPFNRKTIAKSLKRQGLRAKAARKFKATTNSNHSLHVAPIEPLDFIAKLAALAWPAAYEATHKSDALSRSFRSGRPPVQ